LYYEKKLKKLEKENKKLNKRLVNARNANTIPSAKLKKQ
jgi:hypothetical protein